MSSIYRCLTRHKTLWWRICAVPNANNCQVSGTTLYTYYNKRAKPREVLGMLKQHVYLPGTGYMIVYVWNMYGVCVWHCVACRMQQDGMALHGLLRYDGPGSWYICGVVLWPQSLCISLGWRISTDAHVHVVCWISTGRKKTDYCNVQSTLLSKTMRRPGINHLVIAYCPTKSVAL